MTTTLTGIRVFVVEDESLIAMFLEGLLEDLGCRVVSTAVRLEDALLQAALIEIDIATLDINLVGKLSYPIADILRARGIPFIFVTGYGTKGLPPHLNDVLVVDKPVRADLLAAALSVALKLPRP